MLGNVRIVMLKVNLKISPLQFSEKNKIGRLWRDKKSINQQRSKSVRDKNVPPLSGDREDFVVLSSWKLEESEMSYTELESGYQGLKQANCCSGSNNNSEDTGSAGQPSGRPGFYVGDDGAIITIGRVSLQKNDPDCL